MTEAEKRADPCDYEDLDQEKFGFTRLWEGLRKALSESRRREVYTNSREYDLAKKG